MELNLVAKTEEQKEIKKYLEENASDVLAEKINNGKKTLQGCWNFITNEAKKYLNNKTGGIIDKVVFGWAVHYFEEDSIEEGKIDNSNNSTPTKAKEQKKKIESKPKEKKQPTIEDLSMNLFDFGLEVEEDTKNENNN